MKKEYRLTAYTWSTEQTGTKANAKAKLELNGDAGVRVDFPLEFEEDFYFGQRLTAYVGGKQKYVFESDFLNMEIELKFYPLWADLFRNDLYFRTYDLTFCDEMFYTWAIGKTILEAKLEVGYCEFAVYENILKSGATTTPVCSYEEIKFKDLWSAKIAGDKVGILVDTCEDKVDELEALEEELAAEDEPALEEEILVEEDELIAEEETDDLLADDDFGGDFVFGL